jgi:hypothetical protein
MVPNPERRRTGVRRMASVAPLLLLVLGLTSSGCALAFDVDGGCYRPAPRCGPPVFVVPRRRCR